MKRVAEVPFDTGGAPPTKGCALAPDWGYDEPKTSAEVASQTRIQRVIGILEDEDETDLAGAMRLLAVEIASTLSPIHKLGDEFSSAGRIANGRIKNLRELSKQIQEAADMSTRDFLNFDGPRFQFVFREMMQLFRSSIIKGGLAVETADHVIRVFCEEFQARELKLRQETSKLDPSTMASAFTVESSPSQSPTGETDA
jgi:hypothetical protein